MIRRFAPAFAVVLILLVTAPSLQAQEAVPLRTWQAPIFWSPGTGVSDPSSGDPLMKISRVESESITATSPTPLPLISLAPCRLADSRSGSGFPAGYGPPSLSAALGQRSYTIIGRCTIPPEAQGVSFNFTVWAPVTRGDIRVFPAGAGTPLVSTLNWEANILAIANAAIVPLGAGGAITVQVDGPGTIDLIIDVNGYFAPQSSFCIGADCRTSWNGQDGNSVTPLPRDCAPGQVPVATGSFQWKCGNICQAAGTADCGGTTCSNILTDPDRCGACQNVCSSNHMATRTCGNGACNGTCAAGWADCDQILLSNGCETNSSTDPNNCGSCGKNCSSNHMATRTCAGGVCNGTCAAGWVDCNQNLQSDGCEINTSNDSNNCGACGNVCPPHANGTPVCSGSICTFTCNASFTNCGSLCTNTATDPTNCGACGNVCVSGHPCVAGICQ
jgi:hypothetical protein